MNEKQLIKKLETLKKVQPSRSLLTDIKEDVHQQLHLQESNNSTKKRFSLPSYWYFKQSQYLTKGLVIAAFIGFILLLSYLVSPNTIATIALHTRLALAPNQYEKAAIALADTTAKYGSKQTVTSGDRENISSALALTNTQMSELKLKGEEGKYTANQCHDLYQQYFTYLQKEYTNTPQSFPQLRSQISSYEEQAEKKLNRYHHL